MDDVVQAVSSGLEDLSISRPTSRLTWGVPVPNDDSQTIYVWLDALLNYATKIGYPWPPGKMGNSGWPPDCHVIGKDITRFHCIYWPAFLMALSLPISKRVLTTAHWTMNSQKMSKSVGNVVNPFFALDRFGADAMRYYLAHDGGISQDANYSNYYVVERYKKGLQGGLGNLASRIMKGRGWDVRRAVISGKENSPKKNTEQQARARAHFNLLQGLAGAVQQKLQALDVSGGLKTIMEAVYEVSAFGTQWHLLQWLTMHPTRPTASFKKLPPGDSYPKLKGMFLLLNMPVKPSPSNMFHMLIARYSCAPRR